MQAELARHADWSTLDVAVIGAPDVVGMDESAAQALRRKPRSSVMVAAGRVCDGAASALVTAGHTGAAVVAAHAVLGMLDGVERPALAPSVPTRAAPPCCSTRCDGRVPAGALVQFGVMGAAYARLALGLDRPRVGLLSIGEEASKGNELTREAHRLLRQAPVQFVGNVEARGIFAGDADVVVADGFTGNVALKLCEGMVEMVEGLLREELQSTFSSQMGYLLSRRAFRRFRRRVDYSEYGGAPLLGTAGVIVVGHGRSSVKAIRNAVAQAARLVRDGGWARMQADMRALGRASHRDCMHLSGQGSQAVGMGPEMARRFPAAEAASPRPTRRSVTA